MTECWAESRACALVRHLLGTDPRKSREYASYWVRTGGYSPEQSSKIFRALPEAVFLLSERLPGHSLAVSSKRKFAVSWLKRRGFTQEDSCLP